MPPFSGNSNELVMNTSSANNDNSSSRGGGRKGLDEQTVIPVTIRMILNAQPSGDDGVMLRDGRYVHLVKLVAALRTFEEQSTNVMFTLEDGTGLIEVKQWADTNDSAGVSEMRAEACQDNIYLRIVGQLKEYEGRITVIGLSVRKISNSNEITHHMLDTVYVSEKFKRSATPSQYVSSNAYNTNVNSFNPNPGMNFKQQTPNIPQSNNGGSDFTEIVRKYIGNSTSPIGVSFEEIVQGLHVSPEKAKQACEELSSNGLIYSTINDNCFKVC